MSETPSRNDHRHPEKGRVHDVIGVGLGPANLALAVALEEGGEQGQPPLDGVFLERKAGWAWHPDMMLEGAHVQISFLKDLVTLSNPRSRFSFLSYLHDRGRLHEFVNLRRFHPTRVEFNDYFDWAAERLDGWVIYGQEVVALRPVARRGDGRIDLIEVEVRDVAEGTTDLLWTHDLVLGTGGVPRLPEVAIGCRDARVFHSHRFLERLREAYGSTEAPYRFLVVGSGQSGAEIFSYLLSHYPNARISAAIRRFAYKPLDDSHFVNELFFPQMIDTFYDAPPEKRRMILEGHPDINTSAVDLDLINQIYTALYDERAAGRDRARILPFSELVGLEPGPGGVVSLLGDSLHDRTTRLEADAVILATGYDRPRGHPLLGELAPYLVENGNGGYTVGRDYRIASLPELSPNVFLQGFCEETHGVTDPLLSLLPVRSQEIVRSLLAHRQVRLGQRVEPGRSAPTETPALSTRR